MTTITGKWLGTIQGTNNGSVFAEFVETNERIIGVIKINDNVHGVGI